MIPSRSVYTAFLKVSVSMMIQYRASGVIWMIGMVLEPVVLIIVWSTAASSGGDVRGMTAADFAAYYIVVMVVNHLTFSWIMEVFQYRVQFGEFSFQLLRPVHPIHADIADNIAYKLIMLAVLVPAVVACTLIFRPDFTLTLHGLFWTGVIVPVAFLVRFLLEWSLALVTFWTTRINAVNRTYFAVMMFMSGRVAPIALLPGSVQDVAFALPFYYVVAFPAEIALGQVDESMLVQGMGMLIIWLAISLGVIATTWRFAARKFSAVGG